jgi:hypothetical protein
VVAQGPEQRARHDDRDAGPDELPERVAVEAVVTCREVEAVDHHQAEPVEQGRDGQQQGVGIRRLPPQHQVEEQDEDQQAAADGH